MSTDFSLTRTTRTPARFACAACSKIARRPCGSVSRLANTLRTSPGGHLPKFSSREWRRPQPSTPVTQNLCARSRSTGRMINQLESKTAYEDWHSRLQVDDLANTPWHQLIREHMGAQDLAGKRVLEIGCGRGGFACWMARQRPGPSQIVAADFSFTAVQKGRQFASENGLSRIAWEVMDIEAITHESGSFDTVISCETIEHVPDPWQA